MKRISWKRPLLAASLSVVMGAGLVGCNSSSSSSDGDVETGGNNNNDLATLSERQINAPDGKLSARIQTTTGGVPHITADNLESAGFGSGYVQARDNVCIIADSIIRARGERAMYYGPGPGSINVVTDFSYRALGLMEKAQGEFDELSAPSQAMLRGFAAGYNKYLAETDKADLPKKCRGGDWVRPIDATDLYAYYQLIALYASGDQFTTGVTFSAAPPGVEPGPTPAPMQANAASHSVATPDFTQIAQAGFGIKSDYTDRGMGSNGWGIGSEMTENGKGALLANPHFPYTGNRRLYQSQVTVPGVYDVNGATLIGFVVPLIGFNDNVAWTHTVSTARHFTFYQLQLAEGDDLTYIKDGQEKPITSRTFTIDVANGTPNPNRLEKTFYYSEYGPMIAADVIPGSPLPAWGETFTGKKSAFTYRDANTDTARQAVDQWLGMGRARNLDDFKQPFQSCGSVFWVNTMYTDDSGQAFYIDGTSVPQLSKAALQAFQSRAQINPFIGGLAKSGITLLEGNTSRDDWIEGDCGGRVAYSGEPKLERRDFVQNSNDSYWATNPDAFLTGYSPLYGPVETPLSPRTRMGLRMLQNPTDGGLSNVQPAGSDGKFTGEEIIKALYSNRAYYAETLLDELLTRCEAIGTDDVTLSDDGDNDTDDSPRAVAAGCTALKNWDGVYDVDSKGAHVFRVFVADYSPDFPGQFSVAFDPTQPETTPSTPNEAPEDVSQDPMLASLARGLSRLDQVNIDYDTRLGDVQRQQQSAGTLPGQTAAKSGAPIEWPGNQNLEGGFNIVRPDTSGVEDGTRYPRYAPDGTIAKTGDLSITPKEGWLVAYGTSWHFGLSFTDQGPKGYGLVSYSQSDDPGSEHFEDQDQRFSKGNYRELLYRQADISADPELKTETISVAANDDSNTGTDSDSDSDSDTDSGAEAQ